MEDMMSIKSSFMNAMISKVANSMIHKAGFEANVRFHGISVEHSDGGKVQIRADVVVDATEKDIRKLMKNV